MYAAVAFEHLDWSFTAGQEVPADHPMIELRPDLFTDTKPTKRRTPPPASKE